MLLYIDDDFLAVNKKAGISVHDDPSSCDSLTGILEPEYGRLRPVHRIDTPVTGVVLLARNKRAAAALSKQFADNSPVKRYIAATADRLSAPCGKLEDNIFIPSGKIGGKVRIRDKADKRTKKASLKYREIFKTEKYFIYEIILETGRRHQIRAQLAHAGAHIKGDVKYGARRTNRGGGIHLHALSIGFLHPKDGRSLTISAPLPDDPIWNAVPPDVYELSAEKS